MSTYNQQIAIIDESIKAVSKKFRHVVPGDSDIKWATERVFALDLMRKNKKLRIATPDSQVSALLQAGSMGLTLNPAAGECYLIPRAMCQGSDTQIAYASPSYRGLIKTAVDSGAILYGVAEVVHRNDVFKFYGKTKEPVHEVDVMKERGAPVGAYAMARLPSGYVIAEWMDEAAILAVKNKSENPNGLMWNDFWTQGWCKAVLRRAQKTWPRSQQLNTAVEILNENEGIIIESDAEPQPFTNEPVLLITQDQEFSIHSKFTDNDIDVAPFIEYLKKIYNIDAIEGLPAAEFDIVFDLVERSVSAKLKEREAASASS